jgi:catechol-2,3-dioxygenase
MQRTPRPFATSISAGRRLLAARCFATLQAVIELEGIDHVALAVRDVERSTRWYIEVLGFEHRLEGMWDGVPVFVGKGKTALALFPAREDARPPSGRPDQVGMLHLAFRANRAEFANAQRELKSRGIEFNFDDHEVSHSIYFADPDGNRLEITTYEVTP